MVVPYYIDGIPAGIDKEDVELALVLHDLEDSVRSMNERIKHIKARLHSKHDRKVRIGDNGYGRLDLGVFMIKVRPGNRRGNMPMLLSVFGEDRCYEEEYIIRGDPTYALVNLDPALSEKVLRMFDANAK